MKKDTLSQLQHLQTLNASIKRADSARNFFLKLLIVAIAVLVIIIITDEALRDSSYLTLLIPVGIYAIHLLGYFISQRIYTDKTYQVYSEALANFFTSLFSELYPTITDNSGLYEKYALCGFDFVVANYPAYRGSFHHYRITNDKDSGLDEYRVNESLTIQGPLSFEMTTDFSLEIFPRVSKNMLDSHIQSLQENIFVEDPNFTESFRCTSNNELEAYKYLDPKRVSNLLELKNNHPLSSVTIKNNQVIIKLNGMNVFTPYRDARTCIPSNINTANFQTIIDTLTNACTQSIEIIAGE